MMTIENLSFAYQKEKVISDLSLQVEANQLVGLVGLSGSGKTTLLKILSGLLIPTKGLVTINGIPAFIQGRRNKKLYENVGVVFQEYNLFMHLTVCENVALAYRLNYKTTKQESETKANQILSELGLADQVYKYPYECSGGQKQRIAIARALILNPSILFIDEPTSALDKENTHMIVRVLKKLNNKGLTVVVITHDLSFAQALCQRIIEIDQGGIIKDQIVTDYFNEIT
jgi:ABC-type polar amino acid transport system ATPase subunit